ncbi:MAG: preprotein translocase subunit SecY [Clostridia bacterium]|nr:preprotein translocase subunit SecY [Clostridia bacterium]
MLQTLKNAWKIPELKSKLLFTLMIIVLYRLGSNLPMPWVDPSILETYFKATGGGLSWLNMLSGGALAQATLFALSVSPYITASIVMQLLTIAIPKLEAWAKEGEAGKKKISAITRILTVGLALVTAIGYTMFMNAQGMLTFTSNKDWTTFDRWFAYVVLVLAYCAGASVIMWLAEKINEHGIGNGISIILFANIIARLPSMFGNVWDRCFTRWHILVENEVENWRLVQWPIGALLLALFAAILIAAVVAVVWFSNSERRIPVQYAKRVVGRKMYGGQSTTLPIKLDMAGVMPVIFASSIVSILPTIAGFIPASKTGFWGGFRDVVNNYLGHNSFPYIAMQLILIIAFAYFYIMISFNPVEVANNLRSNGGAVPGIRPGKPTVDYIKKILNRITLLGAIFLCGLSGIPMIVNAVWFAIDGVGIADLAFSGTSLLIVVGVALETFRELEAQMTLRNYKGFLD